MIKRACCVLAGVLGVLEKPSEMQWNLCRGCRWILKLTSLALWVKSYAACLVQMSLSYIHTGEEKDVQGSPVKGKPCERSIDIEAYMLWLCSRCRQHFGMCSGLQCSIPTSTLSYPHSYGTERNLLFWLKYANKWQTVCTLPPLESAGSKAHASAYSKYRLH